MKKVTTNLFSIVFLLMATVMFSQGNTNSSLSGKVEDKDGTLRGASVLAVHTPSGTKYSASTDEKGYFRISNMRTGGPYKVTFTFVGYKAESQDEIYLALGETFNTNVVLTSESSVLEEV